jgi:hypothetical protein
VDLFEVLTPARILVEEQARALLEFNGCHTPSDGQFCSAYGPSGRNTRAGRKQRAKDVAKTVGKELAVATDPARMRSLTRRGQVAKAVLDHLKATGLWGTITGASNTAKRVKYPPRLSRLSAA